MAKGNNSPGRGARARPWTLSLACAALAAAALGSLGFVHQGIQERRSRRTRGWRADRWRAAEESWDARWKGRATRWQSPRARRRLRGRRYGREVIDRRQVRRYVFGRRGSGGGAPRASLPADVVNQTLMQHNDKLGQCLMRHGAKRVHIRFDIKGNGVVSTVSLDVNGSAARCLKRVLKGVRFPKRPGALTHSDYHLRLQ